MPAADRFHRFVQQLDERVRQSKSLDVLARIGRPIGTLLDTLDVLFLVVLALGGLAAPFLQARLLWLAGQPWLGGALALVAATPPLLLIRWYKRHDDVSAPIVALLLLAIGALYAVLAALVAMLR